MSPLDPFLVFKYLGMVIRMWRRLVSWKWILAGWGLSTIVVVILQLHGN